MLVFKDKPHEFGSNYRKPLTETIAERVHRHLRDKKSEITEEDIRNARIEWEIRENHYEDLRRD
jgi:hypothetical protein